MLLMLVMIGLLSLASSTVILTVALAERAGDPWSVAVRNNEYLSQAVSGESMHQCNILICLFSV